MRILLLTIFSVWAFLGGAAAQTPYDQTGVKRFREIRDESFRKPGVSPLLRADFLKFGGLEYFEISEKYAVTAKFEKTSDAKEFMMPVSVGASRKYFKTGVLIFELDGQKFSLAAFLSEAEMKKNGTSFFVPFRDLTNGRQTYGAGRYLNIEIPAGDEALLDFNFAYNPSCAYGDESYSCAVPPRENFLQIEIKAGEKSFPYSAPKQ